VDVFPLTLYCFPARRSSDLPLIRSSLALPDPFTPRPPSRERLQQEPATTPRGKDGNHRLSAHSGPPSGHPTQPGSRPATAHQGTAHTPRQAIPSIPHSVAG